MKSDNSDNIISNNNYNLNIDETENIQTPVNIRRINISENNFEAQNINSDQVSNIDFEQVSEYESSDIVEDSLQINNSETLIEKSVNYLPKNEINEFIYENILEPDPVGSNRKFSNDDTIIKEPAIRLNTETLKQYLKPARNINLPDSQREQVSYKPWEIDRRNGSKVYELVGYTTLSKIHHGIKKEKRQSLLKRILITLMLFIIIVIILYALNPIKDLVDFRRIIGIKSMYGENYDENIKKSEINDNPENSSETDIDPQTNSTED
ncbi:MAG TPA: hypothetical protein GXZ43_08915 [Clostridiaceae bacterium]|nr:hypothetical protein [Clostridiaceae bacterium]